MKFTVFIRENSKCNFFIVDLHTVPGELSFPQVRLFTQGMV